MTSLRGRGMVGRWLHDRLLPWHQATERRLHDLTYLFLELTLRCNLDCRHCGSDCTRDTRVPDLPAEKILEVLHGIRRQHDPSRITVALTGGEPLLYPDLFSLGREITRLGFPWGMVSNGWAWNPDKLEQAREAGMRTITISLDGPAAAHDWLRGRPGSFDRACDTLRMLAGADWVEKYDVVTCVHRRNLPLLDETRALLGELGVPRIRLFTVSPIGRAAGDPDLMLDREEFRTLMSWVADRRGTPGPEPVYSESGFLGSCEMEVRDHAFFCRAGINIAGIMADGGILACPNIDRRFCQGNIFADDFCEVWEKKYQVFRDRAWMKSGECAGCDQWGHCQGNSFHLRDPEKEGTRLCYVNSHGLRQKEFSAGD